VGATVWYRGTDVRRTGEEQPITEQLPNLFDYAAKELSQDAMICRLVSWTDNKFADSNTVG